MTSPVPGPQTSRTAAVVVHHRAYPGVLRTIDSLVAQGIDPSAIVVDNSEVGSIATSLAENLPHGVTLLVVPNDGYAASANVGIEHVLSTLPERPAEILVSTHETVAGPGALDALRAALDADASLGVVGPALLNAEQSTDTLWSTGGVRTELTRRAKHAGHGTPLPQADAPLSVVERDWLDGSFCLYRVAALEQRRLEEGYFLYFEEVDMHWSLQRDGWRVACVTSVWVEQSSHGMPPFYYGRNLRLIQRRHGTARSRLLAAPEALALIGREVLQRHRPWWHVRDFLQGWFAWRGGVARRRR